MKKFLVGVAALASLAAATASTPAAPSTPSQRHEARWHVALGPPGLPMSGGCWGDLIVVPQPGGEDVWYAQMDVDPRTWGTPFKATFRTDTEASAPYLMRWIGVTFLDTEGERVGEAGAGGYGTIGKKRIARGNVPTSATTAFFWACEDIGPFTAIYHAGGGA